jgi:hypothetical protein
MKVSNLNILNKKGVPFWFRPDNILIVIAILFCLLVAFNYMLHSLEGRWTTDMPTIAEMVMTNPNDAVMSAVSIIGFPFFSICSSVVTWGEVYGVFHQLFLRFDWVSAAICSLFLLVFGHFHLNEWMTAESIGILSPSWQRSS